MNDENLRKAHILMLDNEVGYLSLLENVLSRFGYKHIRCITDGTRILEDIADFQPDLLILDLHMPKIDGFQVLDQIRKTIEPEAAFPILVMTGAGTPDDIRKALAGGATDLLRKPCDTSEMMIRIRNLLETRFLQIEIRRQNLTLEEKVAERTSELEKVLVELKATQHQVVQQERLHAFGEMAAGVVHDFKNALMSVIGYSELLLNDSELIRDEAVVTKYLRIMNTAGRDATKVIGRLRDFYRPREETDLFEPIDLNKIIKEAMLLTQPKWKDQALAAGRLITVDLDFAKVPMVLGNASDMRAAITNLIFNAADAMPHGGTITLYTEEQDGEVIFEVRDTGTGMSEEVRSRCLEPFFSTKGDNGTGLGLSMVFGIIQRHDGKLEIESEPGKGTVFRTKFRSHIECGIPVNERQRLDRLLRVLVVDDDPISRDVVSKYLQMDGHQVVTAINGIDAIAQFKAGIFDLLLTDQGMPGMNGAQLADALKQTGGGQPTILFTGFDDPMQAAGTVPPGIDAVLSKPISHDELRQALYDVMPTLTSSAA